MGSVAAAKRSITSLRRAELRESGQQPKERFQLGGEVGCAWWRPLLRNLHEAALVVNRSGAVMLTNAAYRTMFGSATELPVAEDSGGRPLPMEVRPERLALGEKPFDMEFMLTGPDGTRRWYQARGEPIQGRGGQLRGGMVVFSDITDRSLHRLQNEFISRVSHELGAPLAAVILSLRMIQRRLPDDSANPRAREVRGYTETALWEGERMRVLVGDLIDMTRLQKGKLTLRLQEEDLVPLVRRAVTLAQLGARSQTFVLAVPGDPLLIKGDATRLEQIVVNLLSNAMQHAPLSERVDVRLGRVNGHAELQVQDYGPGIRAAEVLQLFSRFNAGERPAGEPPTTSSTGLGLGLFISKELVEAHGGTISVDSVEGSGALFRVRLPLAQSHDTAPVCTVATVPGVD
jgi:two-component system, chemotaxis family, CheB/CheR fusion protein